MKPTESFLEFMQVYLATKASRTKAGVDDAAIAVDLALKMVELRKITMLSSNELVPYLTSRNLIHSTIAKLRLEELGHNFQRVTNVAKQDWVDRSQDKEDLRIKKMLRRYTLEGIIQYPNQFTKGSKEYLEAIKRSDILTSMMEEFYHGRLDANIAVNSQSELEKEAAKLFIKDVDTFLQIKAHGIEGYLSSVEREYEEQEKRRKHEEIYGDSEIDDEEEDAE